MSLVCNTQQFSVDVRDDVDSLGGKFVCPI